MRACFDSDAPRRHRRRCASVSSGIDCASPPLACSFSSDVSASRGSAYLGLSDDDDDDDRDLDLDLDLDDRYHDRYDDDDDDDGRYESSKRQKLASRSSPPVFSPAPHLPVSLPGPYDLPEQQPEMTTSAHQRLQDVLSSTPAPPPRSVNPRRTNPPATPHQPPRLLKRSSSIRLSTSLEGKATVVLDEAPESPPLPPSSQPLPIPASVPRSTGPQRRIVDSKIWEFYCDNQAMIRSPGHPHLQPAEAKQALGLLRNKVKPAPSSPITQKKVVVHRRQPPSSPTKAKKSRKLISKCTARPRKLPLLRDPGHESDKENRPPGAPVSPPPEPSRRVDAPRKSRKRKRQGGDARRILGDVPPPPLPSSSSYEPPSSSHDAEMESSQPVRVDEMECVENLLSLRGGTWR